MEGEQAAHRLPSIPPGALKIMFGDLVRQIGDVLPVHVDLTQSQMVSAYELRIMAQRVAQKKKTALEARILPVPRMGLRTT